MKEIFGLPAHPFFVHVPVVLIPLVCVGAIAIAIRPAWRRQFGWLMVGASGVVLIATLLTVSSGEEFDKRIGQFDLTKHHRELGETTRLLVIALFVAVLALVFVGRYLDRQRASIANATWARPLMIALAAITVGAAALSTVWVARTGHEGTKIVWEPPGSST
jgi:hypothetical protein